MNPSGGDQLQEGPNREGYIFRANNEMTQNLQLSEYFNGASAPFPYNTIPPQQSHIGIHISGNINPIAQVQQDNAQQNQQQFLTNYYDPQQQFGFSNDIPQPLQYPSPTDQPYQYPQQAPQHFQQIQSHSNGFQNDFHNPHGVQNVDNAPDFDLGIADDQNHSDNSQTESPMSRQVPSSGNQSRSSREELFQDLAEVIRNDGYQVNWEYNNAQPHNHVDLNLLPNLTENTCQINEFSGMSFSNLTNSGESSMASTNIQNHIFDESMDSGVAFDQSNLGFGTDQIFDNQEVERFNHGNNAHEHHCPDQNFDMSQINHQCGNFGNANLLDNFANEEYPIPSQSCSSKVSKTKSSQEPRGRGRPCTYETEEERAEAHRIASKKSSAKRTAEKNAERIAMQTELRNLEARNQNLLRDLQNTLEEYSHYLTEAEYEVIRRQLENQFPNFNQK